MCRSNGEANHNRPCLRLFCSSFSLCPPLNPTSTRCKNMAIPVFAVLCLIVGGPYLCLGWQHYVMTGVVNVAAQSVLLFLCLNFIVCLWELCLCYRYSLIHSTHQKRVKDGQVRKKYLLLEKMRRVLCTVLYCTCRRVYISSFGCFRSAISHHTHVTAAVQP